MRLLGDIVVVTAFRLGRVLAGIALFLIVGTLLVSALGPVWPVLFQPLFWMMPEDPELGATVATVMAVATLLLVWAIRDFDRLKAFLRRR